MERASPRSPQHHVPDQAPAKQDQVQLKKSITAAAIAAAAAAAPGQRERAVADAVHVASAVAGTAQVQKESFALPEETLGTAIVQDGVYQAAAWGEAPPSEDTVNMFIEVLKGGSLIQSIPVPCENTFVTFGRAPATDVRVDHTSTSRLHAVLQFRGRAVFLADMGSTHGSMLNGKQLEPFLFYHVAVGSQFRLGHSTRSYAFNAPQEWQLPEGPNMVQRKRARAEQAVLEQAAAAAQRDKIVAEKTMHAALHGRLEWDAQDADVRRSNAEVDWHEKMDKGCLSEKQLKVAESIRSKEYKLQKTQEAANKIGCREGPDQHLTPGQAAALLNSEKAIDRLQNEIDDLEETMQESLRDSQHGRDAQLQARQRKKRSNRQTETYSDSDDEFFDRTQQKKVKSATQAVITVKSLLAKLEELQAEERRLLSQLEDVRPNIMMCSPSMHGMSGVDSLDSLMSSVEAQGAEEDAAKVKHLLRLTREQISQQHELLDIADPHQDQRSVLSGKL